MKSHKVFSFALFQVLVLAIVLVVGVQNVSADFLLLDPPADVDKQSRDNNHSCWLATAANMLAGAGYGHGSTVQERAESIYAELIAHFGIELPGWPKTAIDWWLEYRNNRPQNPYDICESHGYPMETWQGQDIPRRIGDWLRGWNFVGLYIESQFFSSNDNYGPGNGPLPPDPDDGTIPDDPEWPDDSLYVASVLHSITAWGDEADEAELTDNPKQVWVTDSDSDYNGDIQTYDYSWNQFTQEWNLNYTEPLPTHLRGAVVLRPLDIVTDARDTQLVVGSYRIHQNYEKYAATDLHYTVGTDTYICSYRTAIDWPRPINPSPPFIEEQQYPPQSLVVDWDLSEDSVPFCEWVTITTEFVLSSWNSIRYTNVYWTYPATGTSALPGFEWSISTPQLIDPNSLVANVTGGYVIGSFDIVEIRAPDGEIQSPRLVGQYRFQHEYLYFQDPERHNLELMALEVPYSSRAYFVANLRLGHSYSRLGDDLLWKFDKWMTEYPEMYAFGPREPVRLQIDWEDRLPYPKAVGPMPACLEYTPGDLNMDCVVDFKDFAIMAGNWLSRTESVVPDR